MRIPKRIGLELAVAGLALAAAAAFAQASASGQAAPIFTMVEQQADELARKLFLGGECVACHELEPAARVPAPAATSSVSEPSSTPR